MKRVIFATVLSLVPFSFVHAYTECTLTLTRIFAEDGGSFYIGTGGGLNGIIEYSTAGGYRNSIAIAIAARASGTPVLVRYERDGVVCGSAIWSERISGIGM